MEPGRTEEATAEAAASTENAEVEAAEEETAPAEAAVDADWLVDIPLMGRGVGNWGKLGGLGNINA